MLVNYGAFKQSKVNKDFGRISQLEKIIMPKLNFVRKMKSYLHIMDSNMEQMLNLIYQWEE